MPTEAIIQILLSIIGVLVVTIIGLFVGSIRRDIRELKDMFVRHVRNPHIHVNMKTQPEGVNHGMVTSKLG